MPVKPFQSLRDLDAPPGFWPVRRIDYAYGDEAVWVSRDAMRTWTTDRPRTCLRRVTAPLRAMLRRLRPRRRR